jgi:hypothetical protein
MYTFCKNVLKRCSEKNDLLSKKNTVALINEKKTHLFASEIPA